MEVRFSVLCSICIRKKSSIET